MVAETTCRIRAPENAARTCAGPITHELCTWRFAIVVTLHVRVSSDIRHLELESVKFMSSLCFDP